ncbi:MAG TPA: hypothetical protein VF013_11180 [Candidatus Limnocylindria bacterium]
MRPTLPKRLIPIATCLLGLAALAGLGPMPARADCQPIGSTPEALAGADVAFVGTVIGVARVASTATFRVEETWKGSLPASVQVRGTSDASFAEDDRQWQVGGRYLVIPYLDGGVMRDNLCTGTTPWADALAALRPAGVEPYAGPDAGSSGDLLPFAVGAAAVTLIVGAVVSLAGRGPRRRTAG